VNCKEKNCKYKRRRKTAAYGRTKGKSWHCPCDKQFGSNYEDVNPKRERQKGKKQIKKERP